ncbi:MAG: orotate phosphoribosyltransferase [Nostoc sp. ZfuVER08]|uniref:Orotate phosphoribosyltransferase n=1 Tax=Nostoc punctiforme FACHB-252 TaxID=1357509 RepID=A0ABR8H3K4_NOSPU|nr:orotate phosphoribosyltransferase [Nostoc punctiforme]MBD2610293.1 orotate phosphoribosyltransferase [Nostoc punctiforme FACHB-252]MBL1201688.1 orotate phosphoribosyltransferase [Nostoc sp. GBBB01]MDZ8016175.1 orotate phosphoribosyltransferase [Nostoc sp. ZfuVER08]
MEIFNKTVEIETIKSELAKQIYAISHLDGSFKLRSGRISNEYFDKYQFEADPILLNAIVRQMVTLIPSDIEVLAGLELGGISIVTLLSQYSSLPTAFVRKEAKKYGTSRLAEGAEINNRKVLIVEDVVTSGGQIAISAHQLRQLGAEIDYALCVIDREEGAAEKLLAEKITLLSLLKRRDLPT